MSRQIRCFFCATGTLRNATFFRQKECASQRLSGLHRSCQRCNIFCKGHFLRRPPGLAGREVAAKNGMGAPTHVAAPLQCWAQRSKPV